MELCLYSRSRRGSCVKLSFDAMERRSTSLGHDQIGACELSTWRVHEANEYFRYHHWRQQTASESSLPSIAAKAKLFLSSANRPHSTRPSPSTRLSINVTRTSTTLSKKPLRPYPTRVMSSHCSRPLKGNLPASPRPPLLPRKRAQAKLMLERSMLSLLSMGRTSLTFPSRHSWPYSPSIRPHLSSCSRSSVWRCGAWMNTGTTACSHSSCLSSSSARSSSRCVASIKLFTYPLLM
jgi:hypothetical protein